MLFGQPLFRREAAAVSERRRINLKQSGKRQIEEKINARRSQDRRINLSVSVTCIMGYSQLPVSYICVCGCVCLD